MQQPHLPRGWDELTMDQLREVHRLMAEPVERSVRNLNLYLYLTGMEIAEGEGEIRDDGEVWYYLRPIHAQPVQSSTSKKKGAYKIWSRITGALRSVVKRHNSSEEFFSVKADDLALYLNGCHINDSNNDNDKLPEKLRKKVERRGALDWVDHPVGKDGSGGLMGLPQDEIIIGRKTFLLPSMLITNLTYEQYSNLQKLQQAVWSYTEQVQELQKQLLDIESEMMQQADNTNDPSKASANDIKNESSGSHRSPVDMERIKPLISKIEEAMREVRKYRMQFLAHALLEKEVDDRGVVVGEYKSNVSEVMAPFMEKHAPEWLFDILVQHMQSCLGMYKTQFPELFSKDGGGGRDVIPLVSEVETINAIQKWQGYQEQQKVYDTNAVFVFSILNSMTKEAKAIEDANAKMKSRSRH